jgi:hypothetical protein
LLNGMTIEHMMSPVSAFVGAVCLLFGAPIWEHGLDRAFSISAFGAFLLFFGGILCTGWLVCYVIQD